MITCTSTVHHGDTRLTATGTGATRQEAFLAAVEATDVGYRPNPGNTSGGVGLLERWDRGERPPPARSIVSDQAYAYLSERPDGEPAIEIGWCDFTFTPVPPVRLWAVTAQVEWEDGRGGGSRQVPTFYLDPSVQGITDAAHAERIAGEILATVSVSRGLSGKGATMHITVEPTY